MVGAKFLHTNLVARRWEQLASFYEGVFGCIRVLPERDLHGDSIERGTGVAAPTSGACHLRLPGTGNDGPTLDFRGAFSITGVTAPTSTSFATRDVPANVARHLAGARRVPDVNGIVEINSSTSAARSSA
jgi:hypothetical protein